MNQKEISELKRRFRLGKNAIGRIYGCYVNSQKEIVSYLDESLDRMPEEEGEKYLALLKKALSGALGRNLIDIVFSTQQVADSDEHRRLMALRDSRLKDGEVRQEFYHAVIDSLDMGESNYLILLAHDAYDVPHRGKDGEDRADEGDTVFCYIVCCVCPVKDGKLELSYCAGENEFHNCAPSQIVSPRGWASCSRPLTTGRPISTMPSPTPASRTSCTRSFWTPSSTPSHPCPPGRSGRRFRPLSGRGWRGPAAWRWYRTSTNS